MNKQLINGLSLIGLGACMALWPTPPAHAGTKVQGNVVPQNIGGTCGGGSAPCFSIGSPGKYSVAESTASGSGGITIQLNVKGVDCAGDPDAGFCSATTSQSCQSSGDCPSGEFCHGNDGGKAGKCNDANHVLELNTDFSGIESKVGLLFDLTKGKVGFQASAGKNKVTGAQAFGAIAGVVQGQNLGIGLLRVRAAGSNPASCLSAPLLVTTCTDGERYGIGGIHASNAPGTAPPPCTGDSDCSLTQVCTAGACVTQTCTADADCRGFTGPTGDVACNEVAGTCCLPALDTDPNCDFD